MIIQEPVQAAIWHCLNHYDLQDAIFLAERLCAEVETDETIFILATCYYRSNQIHQAYWLLQSKSPRSPQCRFLLAKCAYQLKKYAEAESALLSNNCNFADIKNFDDICKEFGECACFALQLIAKICSQTERYNIAGDALKQALKLNPFLWNAYSDLCNYGEKIDPNSIFQIHNSEIFNTCQSNNTNAMILLGGGIGGNNINNNNGNGLTSTITTTTAMGTATILQQHSDSLYKTNSTITAGTDIIPTNNNNSNNYILSSAPTTTIIENSQQQQQQYNITNITTPNNKISSNLTCTAPIAPFKAISIGGGGIGGLGFSSVTTTPNCLSFGDSLEDTPITYGNNNCNNSEDSTMTMNNSNLDNDTPSIKQFKYLSSIKQGTPSFGILPINSPNDSGPIVNYISSPLINTPSPQQQQQTTLIEVNQEPKSIGKKLKGHVGNIIRTKDGPLQQSKSQTAFTQSGNLTPRTPNNALSGQNVRRSSRLFSNNNYSVKENNKSPNINKFVQPRSPPRKTKTRVSKISLNNEINEKDKKEKEKIETITSNDAKVLLNNSLNTAQTMAHHVLTLKKQSAEGLMSLLRELGQGYLQFSQYNCKEAIESFSSIPKHHFKTSWVQSMIGLAHYEQREYETAATIFKEVHENEPHRLQLMEIYSTALWHLQREVALSALAQDLMVQDKNSPITWCVAGNCFSLHKEHETAIKFFKRAVQVDPDFVYSYTLLGHELVITEELDKAMSCFRTAILKDPRHYNAWFGIGTIYSKQERYELAELHYKRALKINPKNSVIMVHIGAMQFHMQKPELALQTLNAAIAVDPKNPLCKFHRGSMYYSLGKHQEALRELEELKQIVPKESVVFYLIGKIHKNLGNVDSALMHFSWATDLDPKGANNQLKDAFDSINHTTTTATTTATTANTTASGGSVASTATNSAIVTDLNIETDIEPNSERSDDSSTHAQLEQEDANYDSDSY